MIDAFEHVKICEMKICHVAMYKTGPGQGKFLDFYKCVNEQGNFTKCDEIFDEVSN
jgi:hypothetical protein